MSSMDRDRFAKVGRSLAELNEALSEVGYLEDLLEHFLALVEAATAADGTINPSSLSPEGMHALDFIQLMLNQLEHVAQVGGSTETPFWSVGDDVLTSERIPELAGATLDELTADLIECDYMAVKHMDEPNNPGGYIVTTRAATAYQVLVARYGGGDLVHLQP